MGLQNSQVEVAPVGVNTHTHEEADNIVCREKKLQMLLSGLHWSNYRFRSTTHMLADGRRWDFSRQKSETTLKFPQNRRVSLEDFLQKKEWLGFGWAIEFCARFSVVISETLM